MAKLYAVQLFIASNIPWISGKEIEGALVQDLGARGIYVDKILVEEKPEKEEEKK